MELIELARRIEEPMKWSESYSLLGMHQGTYTLMGDDRPLKQFTSCWYRAGCLICRKSNTRLVQGRGEAVYLHFYHCAKNHGYIFPESEVRFTVRDNQLQAIIAKSCEYDLPMPGYSIHTHCIKKYASGKVVCAVHVGNEG